MKLFLQGFLYLLIHSTEKRKRREKSEDKICSEKREKWTRDKDKRKKRERHIAIKGKGEETFKDH